MTLFVKNIRNCRGFVTEIFRKKMLEKELEEFVSLEKFDNFLKVLSFYFTERCEHDDCSQGFFFFELKISLY